MATFIFVNSVVSLANSLSESLKNE